MLLLIIFTALSVLKGSHGQYDDKCLMPNQESGRCVPIKSCKTTFELLNNFTTLQQDELLALQCGSMKNVPLVCCDQSEIQLNADGVEILKNNTCGIYSVEKLSIGPQAALFAFPWMALLKYNDELNEFQCGATIISDQYILTAAHCVYKLQHAVVGVRLGEYQISTEIDCVKTPPQKNICSPPPEDVGIEEVIIHEKFVNSLYHDIALIRLNRKINFQSHIKPACLPIYDNLKNEEKSRYALSGWGTTENGTSSDFPMVTVVSLVDRMECEEKLRVPITSGQICAGGKDLVDTCRGDSGGPLGYSDTYNDLPRFIQLAIGLQNCGTINLPMTYTNVAYYLQWITDHMR